MHIAIIAANYPSQKQPDNGSFVRGLAQELARTATVTVVAPQPVRLAGWFSSPEMTDEMDGGVNTLRPKYLTYSARRLPLGFSTFRLTVRSFGRAVARAGQRISPPPHVVHGHFLFPAGAAAVSLSRSLGIPATIALGESTPDLYERHIGLARAVAVARNAKGILAVSDQNRKYAVEDLEVDPSRIIVMPNAADIERFYPHDRGAARQELGLPADKPIVISVGGFVERKGTLRVLQAVEMLPDVTAVFLGSGPQQPVGNRVLFAGAVNHDDVPMWLSAANVFVLPTTAEGSPNAVAEALACGLPVVGSDIPSMRTMVGEDAGVLVEPGDIAGLSQAIHQIILNPHLRDAMSRAALKRARAFTLEERARRAVEWFRRVAEK